MKLIHQDITLENSGLIIHGVNCQRRMGSGVALAIKNKWPAVYDQYMEQGSGKIMLGKLHIIQITPDLFVGNGYTQEFFGYDGAKYADIQAVDIVLHKAFMQCYLNNIQLKAPKIGCQLGGLDWESEVKPLFEKYEDKFGTQAEIYYI